MKVTQVYEKLTGQVVFESSLAIVALGWMLARPNAADYDLKFDVDSDVTWAEGKPTIQ